MAEPIFIYAFDNLGYQKFTDLCNVLLAAQFKGYQSGSVGPDGGVDGSITNSFSFLDNEEKSYIGSTIINEDDTIIFQFKHKTVARIGAGKTRKEILTDFSGKDSELLKKLIIEKKPKAY